MMLTGLNFNSILLALLNLLIGGGGSGARSEAAGGQGPRNASEPAKARAHASAIRSSFDEKCP